MMDAVAAVVAELGAVQELLPDPVLENVGRHLPLNGMRTCRLVCKRWAAVIGESVTAVGVPADMLRAMVLDDAPPFESDLGGGAAMGNSSGGDSDEGGGGGGRAAGEGEAGVAGGDAGGGGEQTAGARERRASGAGSEGSASSDGGRPRRSSAAAMGRLRRQSRKLARAFPRAHTCVIHIDVGYGDHAAPNPHESASRLAALLGGLPNLARIR